MRIKLPLGRTVFFALAFLFMLLATFPLGLALRWLGVGDSGLSAREARGSIWFGRLSEARLGAVPLGDLATGLRTLPLLVGQARIDLSRDDPSAPFNGSATFARHRLGVDDINATLDLGGALAPLPLGSVDLNGVTAHFADGQCESAEGLVRANVAGDVAGLPLAGGLSGTARCDGGALLLPLVSQSSAAALNLRLLDQGGYTVELLVRPLDDAMRDRLLGMGFALGAKGYALNASGQF